MAHGELRPSTRAARKLYAEVRAAGLTCCLCGGWIDHDLHWQDPMAATVEHLVPLSMGGDPTDPANLSTAHRVCNTTRGNRVAPTQVQSRSWL